MRARDFINVAVAPYINESVNGLDEIVSLPGIREKHPLFSKANFVDSLDMNFEPYQVRENQPLRIAHRVATFDHLLRIDTF